MYKLHAMGKKEYGDALNNWLLADGNWKILIPPTIAIWFKSSMSSSYFPPAKGYKVVESRVFLLTFQFGVHCRSSQPCSKVKQYFLTKWTSFVQLLYVGYYYYYYRNDTWFCVLLCAICPFFRGSSSNGTSLMSNQLCYVPKMLLLQS